MGGYFYREELRLEEIYRQLLVLPEKPAAVASDQAENSSLEHSRDPVTAVSETPAPVEVQSQPLDTKPSAPVRVAQPDTAEPDSSSDAFITKPTVSGTVIEQSELLYKARRAYWDKDYDAAIRLYRQLIEEDGDNPDYIGELGNIYYSLNDFDRAAQQLYQAGLALIAQGQPERAGRLVSPVTAMDRELGNDLKRRLIQRR